MRNLRRVAIVAAMLSASLALGMVSVLGQAISMTSPTVNHSILAITSPVVGATVSGIVNITMSIKDFLPFIGPPIPPPLPPGFTYVSPNCTLGPLTLTIDGAIITQQIFYSFRYYGRYNFVWVGMPSYSWDSIQWPNGPHVIRAEFKNTEQRGSGAIVTVGWWYDEVTVSLVNPVTSCSGTCTVTSLVINTAQSSISTTTYTTTYAPSLTATTSRASSWFDRFLAGIVSMGSPAMVLGLILGIGIIASAYISRRQRQSKK